MPKLIIEMDKNEILSFIEGCRYHLDRILEDLDRFEEEVIKR